MDWRPERELPLRFQIDTNRINARGREIYMNRLQRWHDAEVIELLLSEPAFIEVSAKSKSAQATKGIEYIQTLTCAETDDERAMLARIEKILFPGGTTAHNQRKDVEIVFNAQKYGAYLVTNDGRSRRQPRGILGSAAALAELAITVMTDEAACALVERKIRERDEAADEWARSSGLPAPTWIGADF